VQTILEGSFLRRLRVVDLLKPGPVTRRPRLGSQQVAPTGAQQELGSSQYQRVWRPVFQSLSKTHRLTGEALSRRDMLRMVKERCLAAELPGTICNHTFRGTGITVFLQNGGSLEAAQDMANHSDPRTTKLYDRRKDLATLSEIERRIAFE
jgi:site-specific recombinase XerD